MTSDVIPAINTRRLTKWYIIALGMVGLLTILGQVAVQFFIQRLQSDARIVNVAGRQRMLSQRLPLLVQVIQNGADHDSGALNYQEQVVELQSQLVLWKESHDGLQNGSEKIGLPGNNSPTIKKLFSEVDPHFVDLEQAVSQFILRSGASIDRDLISQSELDALLVNSRGFLTGMDKIVSQYEAEAGDRISRLRIFERGLLVATLSILLAEGIFIFSPAISSLRKTFDALRATTDQLREAKRQAESANSAKTDFLTKVSHELRTPLHGLLGMLDLVLRGKLTSSQRTKLLLAQDASQSLERLVSDLLDVASIEARKEIQLAPTAISLRPLVRSVATLMNTVASQKKLSVRCLLAKNLPKYIVADGDRLKQVLANLIQNAIRYTNSGQIVCRVFIDASQTLIKNSVPPCSDFDSPYDSAKTITITFEVSDTGCGIALKDQTRIFESFVRIDQDSHVQIFGEGLGLGLPISAELVRLMNGTISLQSKPGAGSTFRFTIQCKIVNEIGQPENLSPTVASSTHDSPPGRRVLIVDDSRTNRLLLRAFLKKLCFDVCSASSLAKARKAIRAFQPEILLLDRQMTDGDGIDFIRELQRNAIAIQNTFLVTADINTQLESLDANLKIDGVLHKPVTLEELSEALQTVAHEQMTLKIGSVDCARENSGEFDALKSKLYAVFVSNFPDDLMQLEKANRERDFRTIRLVSHRLHGSAANINLRVLAELAAKLEEDAVQQNQPAIDRGISKLREASTQLATTFSS